jgi:hypothetical protein
MFLHKFRKEGVYPPLQRFTPRDLTRTNWRALLSDALERSKRNIMMRAAGIAGVFVTALALTPIGAEAQQIFARVNNRSGTIHVAG